MVVFEPGLTSPKHIKEFAYGVGNDLRDVFFHGARARCHFDSSHNAKKVGEPERIDEPLR